MDFTFTKGGINLEWTPRVAFFKSFEIWLQRGTAEDVWVVAKINLSETAPRFALRSQVILAKTVSLVFSTTFQGEGTFTKRDLRPPGALLI